MKKIAVGAIGIVLVLVIIASIAMSGIAVLFPGKNAFEDSNSDLNLNYYDVEGTVVGNKISLTLKNEQTGEKIEGLEFEVENKSGRFVSYVTAPNRISSKNLISSEEAEGVGDLSKRELLAYRFLIKNGFTLEGAAGLMSNIASESNFLWKSNTEEGDYEGYHGEYQGKEVMVQGYGLFQWTNTDGDTHGRRYKVISYLEERGIDPTKDSDEAFLAQLEYALTEPGYEDIVKRMKNAKDAGEAGRIWCLEWERPRNMHAVAEHRAERSNKYKTSLKNVPKVNYDKIAADIVKKVLSGIYEMEKWPTTKGTAHGTWSSDDMDMSKMEINGAVGGDNVGILLYNLPAKVISYWSKRQGDEKREAAKYVIEGIAAVSAGGEMIADELARIIKENSIGRAVLPWGNMSPTIVSYVGWRCGLGGYHEGVDLAMPVGTPLCAGFPGKIVEVGSDGAAGNYIKIEYDPWKNEYGNTETWTVTYMHLSKITKEGGRVLSQTPVALSGSTGRSYGPHLHLQFNNTNDGTLYIGALKTLTDPMGRTHQRGLGGLTFFRNHGFNVDFAVNEVEISDDINCPES